MTPDVTGGNGVPIVDLIDFPVFGSWAGTDSKEAVTIWIEAGHDAAATPSRLSISAGFGEGNIQNLSQGRVAAHADGQYKWLILDRAHKLTDSKLIRRCLGPEAVTVLCVHDASDREYDIYPVGNFYRCSLISPSFQCIAYNAFGGGNSFNDSGALTGSEIDWYAWFLRLREFGDEDKRKSQSGEFYSYRDHSGHLEFPRITSVDVLDHSGKSCRGALRTDSLS